MPPKPIVLKKDLARSIRRGHPWIYRDALAPRDGLVNGALVEVRTRDKRPIARGFWDGRSPIAVRVLESGGPGHRYAETRVLVADRLRAALDRRLERIDLEKTNAFRWVHGEADLLPGIHVDFYADTVVARFDGFGARAFYDPVEPKLREAAEGRLKLRTVIDRAERDANAAADEREVIENGVHFIVDLAHGQKGGLFLDQRQNRVRVAERAKGKSMLNLFGYTGGFSVHAAAAGARKTDSVDLARPAIEAARRNFEVNGLSLERNLLHTGDAFDFLTDAAARGDRWDIVVSDPPSFATKKDSLPSALSGYRRLHRLAASVVTTGGLLCASSCSSHVTKDDFLETIATGVRQAGRNWTLESVYGAGFDHPALEAFPEGDYLKFAVGKITDARK